MSPDELRTDRINRGMSIGAFAAEIGVKAHVLKYAENGGQPRGEAAKKIADFYGLRVTDLWPVHGADAAANTGYVNDENELVS